MLNILASLRVNHVKIVIYKLQIISGYNLIFGGGVISYVFFEHGE